MMQSARWVRRLSVAVALVASALSFEARATDYYDAKGVLTHGSVPEALNGQGQAAPLSSSNPLPVSAGATAPTATVLQNAATGSANGTVLNVSGYATAIVNVVCSVACTGGTTINFEATDSTGTFFAIQGTPLSGGAGVSTATAGGQWAFNVAGLTSLRARISAYSAGTITATGAAVTLGGGVGSGGGGGGAATIADGADVTQGAQADAACGTDNGTCALIALLKRTNQNITTLLAAVQASITAGTNAIGSVNIVPLTTGGGTPYHLPGGTTASTNSHFIKAAATGTLLRITAINTTGTLGYLKMYDSAGAPTCSSATGLVHVYPIPANTSGAGINIRDEAVGEAYANGIGYCVTGGGGDTDNTNAPAGIYIEANYK